MWKFLVSFAVTLGSVVASGSDDVTLKPGLSPDPRSRTVQELERPESSEASAPSRASNVRPSSSWYDEVPASEAAKGRSSIFSRRDRGSDALTGITNSCRLEILEKLGWKIHREAGRSRTEVKEGYPCDVTSLREAHAAGALQLHLPAGESAQQDPADLAEELNRLLFSTPSICAYKFRVSRAAQVATSRLVDNPGFQFRVSSPMVQFFGSDIPWLGGCHSSRGVQQCFQAKSSPAAAMRYFTEERSATECALGLQIAELETLHQLYGDEAFDRAFQSAEISIAPWSVVSGTSSAVWGRSAHAETARDPQASTASKIGPAWFTGVSGYIGNVFGEAYLGRPVDRGENFLTVEVTPEAAGQLKRIGGFEPLNRMNREIWELARGMSDKARELAGSEESLDRYEMTAQLRARIQKIRGLLAEPVYFGYQVYVHPLKVMSFGGHIARLLRVNPRTPYAMRLYPSRVNSGLYRRYVSSLAAECR